MSKCAATRVIHLVPHTHWDREWYEPFQSFRLRLVELVDKLLDQLEAQPEMAFTLDGQTATVDDERALALTLVRSTGLISRNDNSFRTSPAGPEAAIPGAQCLRPIEATFALMPLQTSQPNPEALRQMELYRHAPLVIAGTGDEDNPSEEPTTSPIGPEGLEVDSDRVVMTSLRRVEDALELRLVNYSDEPAEATVRARCVRAHEVDLLGAVGAALPVERAEIVVRCSPWEIKTLRLSS